MPAPLVLLLMGVSGVGKTAVGQRVAEQLGWTFFDADDVHPPENVAKMRRGEGLTDTDREPWLQAVRTLIDERLAAEAPMVLACSALKASHRAQLGGRDARVAIVWLDAPPEVITERLVGRRGHFAGPDLLVSQLNALERPRTFEALRISAEGDVDSVAQSVVVALGLQRSTA